jgi:outer membrane receptor protein involved in Fe transport
MTSLFRTRLALAATVSTLAFAAAPAVAQGAASTVENEEGVVEEIIVTASKRAQTLQDTPISVAVTTVEAIERSQVRDLIDLQTLVPSLRVSQLQSSANTNFVIRGFGNGANNPGIEPSVGVFIDGVYRSRSAAQIGDLSNIERVEVLRGPQSTLFGKNASAGIISIVTQAPQFELGGNIEASYGNYDAIVLKGAVTGPLSDKVAVAFDGNYNKRDGYARDLNLNKDINDRNRYGVRGQLLFKANEDLKIRFIADYDKIDEICCTVVNIVDGPTGAAVRALGGKINSNQPFSYNSFNNFESTNKIKNYGVSAQADWNVADGLALTSISSYRAVRSNTNQDSDFTSADIIGRNSNLTDIDTYTQELRLASDYDGFFNFLLGGFYFKEDITVDAALTFGRDFRGYANALSGGAYSSNEALIRTLAGLPAATAATAFGTQGLGRFEHYDFRNEAISLFGQGDFKLAEALTFTAGFNYTRDKKRAASNSTTTDTFSTIDLVQVGVRAGVPATVAATSANPFLGLRALQFLPPFLNFPNAVESGRTKDNDLSYTLRLSWEANDNISTYATYATGFKASSFNLGPDSRPFPSDFIPGSRRRRCRLRPPRRSAPPAWRSPT